MTQTVFPAVRTKLPVNLEVEVQRVYASRQGSSSPLNNFEDNNVWSVEIDYSATRLVTQSEPAGAPITDEKLVAKRAHLLRDLHKNLQERVADVELSWQRIRDWPSRHSDVALNFESWLILQYFALSDQHLANDRRTPEAFCEATRLPRHRSPRIPISTAQFSTNMFLQAGLAELLETDTGEPYFMLTDIGMEFVLDDPRAVAFQYWVKRLKEIGCNDVLTIFVLDREQINKAFFRSKFRNTVEYFKSCIGYDKMKKRGPYRKRNELPDPTKPADAYVNRNKHKSSMKSVSVRFQKTLHERTLLAAQAHNVTISEYIKRAVLSQLENESSSS